MTQDETWHAREPEPVPRPTYCPVMLAAGIVLMVWGPLASWLLLAAGAVLFVVAIVWWIDELRHEQHPA